MRWPGPSGSVTPSSCSCAGPRASVAAGPDIDEVDRCLQRARPWPSRSNSRPEGGEQNNALCRALIAGVDRAEELATEASTIGSDGASPTSAQLHARARNGRGAGRVAPWPS